MVLHTPSRTPSREVTPTPRLEKRFTDVFALFLFCRPIFLQGPLSDQTVKDPSQSKHRVKGHPKPHECVPGSVTSAESGPGGPIERVHRKAHIQVVNKTSFGEYSLNCKNYSSCYLSSKEKHGGVSDPKSGSSVHGPSATREDDQNGPELGHDTREDPDQGKYDSVQIH